MKLLRNQITWLTIFSVAMGYLEAAVVVYLRKIYYPDGFDFPLAPIDPEIGLIEVIREAATMIMLLGIAMLTGYRTSGKFAVFIFCFAIWDLFYYVFLKIFLDWPASFFTPDILFLIPVPWIGPVLAPCLLCLNMILLAMMIISFQEKGRVVCIKPLNWLIFITGSLAVILSFLWNYLWVVIEKSNTNDGGISKTDLSGFVPDTFNWWLFLTGEIIILIGTFILYKRIKNEQKFRD